MTISRLLTLSVLVSTSLVACDSQVDSEHQGTALATLEGTVSNERTQPVTGADVELVWITDGPGDLVTGQSVTVEGSFPATFSLAMYEPPDDLVLWAEPGQQFGTALIAAVPPGQSSVEDEPLGVDPDHLLVYLPQDVAAGSFAEYFLHSAPKAGFHIYGFRRLTEAERLEREECILGLENPSSWQETRDTCGGDIFDEVVPLASNLDTPLSVQLVDDIESLNLPNWK